jgi:hypothetical protein
MLASETLGFEQKREIRRHELACRTVERLGSPLQTDREHAFSHTHSKAGTLKSQDVVALKDAVRLLAQECLRPRGLPGNPTFSDLAGLGVFLDDVFVEGYLDSGIEITAENLEQVSTGLSQALSQISSIASGEPQHQLAAVLESLGTAHADIESREGLQSALELSNCLIAVIENALPNESAVVALE